MHAGCFLARSMALTLNRWCSCRETAPCAHNLVILMLGIVWLHYFDVGGGGKKEELDGPSASVLAGCLLPLTGLVWPLLCTSLLPDIKNVKKHATATAAMHLPRMDNDCRIISEFPLMITGI